jgi:hypothetical protein
VHSKHLAELEEKIQQVRARAHRVHTIMAVALNCLIFATSVERQVGKGIF